MRRSLLLLTAVAALAASSPASAFVYVPEPVWFHAVTTPVGTLDHQLGTDITWSSESPTGPGAVTLGNNYSTFTDLLEVPAGSREEHTFVAKGTIDGDLDTLAVDLYFTGPAASVCGMSLAWQVLIDDYEILYTDQAAPSANLKTEAVSRNVYRVRFMLTHIAEALELYRVPPSATGQREVSLNFANFYACQEAVWLYDSPSWPSGMIVNLDPASVAARGYTEVDVLNPPPPLPA